MKKFLTILLTAIIAATAAGLFACAKNDNTGDNGEKPAPAEPVSLSFYMPDGAPALSVAKFVNDKENFGVENLTINYNVVSATEINNAILKNHGDFVIMPVNAATKLYTNNGGENYKLAAVVTHGNFYVMTKDESVKNANDLVGRVVFVPQKGKVPDFTFLAALKNLGIEYEESDTPVAGKVALKYYAQPSDFNKLLLTDGAAIGLVPEPAVSVLKKKGVFAALDLQKLYDEKTESYPQAALMVKESVAASFPDIVKKMGEKFGENADWAKENPAEAVNAVKSVYEQTSLNAAAIDSETIKGCKIYWQSSEEAKKELNAYIGAIREITESAANVVPEEFYL